MTSHTKGPWEDNGNGLIYGQVSGDDDEAPFVADVCRDRVSGLYSAEEQANACLIVAAPKLLLELMVLVDHLEAEESGAGVRASYRRLRIEEARAVIAEANGRAA